MLSAFACGACVFFRFVPTCTIVAIVRGLRCTARFVNQRFKILELEVSGLQGRIRFQSRFRLAHYPPRVRVRPAKVYPEMGPPFFVSCWFCCYPKP